MSINEIISKIGIGLLILNLVLLTLSFVKLNKAYRFFYVYLVLGLIIQLISQYYADNKIPNLHLSHYYFTIQYIVLLLFYRKIFSDKKFNKVSLMLSIAIAVFLTSQYILNPSLYYELNFWEIIITTFPLIVFSVIYFFKTIDNFSPARWINHGIFFYLITSILVFVSGNATLNIKKEIALITWTVNSVMYIIFQILIFIEWKVNLSPWKIK